MKWKNRAREALGAALGLSLVTGVAVANAKERRDTPTDESRILSTAKVTMNQAITAAEQATGGKAAGTGSDFGEEPVSLWNKAQKWLTFLKPSA